MRFRLLDFVDVEGRYSVESGSVIRVNYSKNKGIYTIEKGEDAGNNQERRSKGNEYTGFIYTLQITQTVRLASCGTWFLAEIVNLMPMDSATCHKTRCTCQCFLLLSLRH